MENITVAVVSKDRDYNRVLSAALVNACRELSVEIFNNREFVRLWSDYEGPGAFYEQFDLVLWAGDEVCDSYSDNIIYLTEKLSLARKDFSGSRFCLYRYDSVRSLLASMFEIYSHLTGRSSGCLREKNVVILGFSSSSGGTGCTTLAMAAAQELTRFHHKKVLYVSLENLESTGGFSIDSGGMKSLGEYLYRLLGEETFSTDLKPCKVPFPDSYLIRNAFGVEAFAPSRGKNPLPELSENDMEKFLVSLINCGRYDALVVDISTCLTDAGMAALEMCHSVSLISVPGRSAARENLYLNHITCSRGDEITGKIIKTQNLHESSDSDGTRVTVRKLKGMGPKSIDMTLEGGFGMDISKLTQLMLNSEQSGII